MQKEKINLRDCYCSGVKPTIAYKYEFFINEDSYIWDKQFITGNELHELAGTNSETHFIRVKNHQGKGLIGPNIKVDLTECGIERFIILPFVQETLDLHDCFCQGSIPFITYKYLIKINRDKFEVEQESITGREIIQLINKTPENHRVRMFTSNGKVIIKNDESVDLTKCGVERFVVEPLDCIDGFLVSNTFKQLLVEDLEYLKSFSKVDFVSDGANNNTNWLIIRSIKIPAGYNLEEVDMAILIPNNYPVVHLDMVYFNPPLSRLDKKPINKLTQQLIEGKIYQRWSRHRTGINKWDSETDNLESHIDLMMNCLKQEFNKR